MRLTKKQAEFLESIMEGGPDDESSYECFDHELRTALSLHKRGLVEFPEGLPTHGERWFMARATEAGKSALANA